MISAAISASGEREHLIGKEYNSSRPSTASDDDGIVVASTRVRGSHLCTSAAGDLVRQRKVPEVMMSRDSLEIRMDRLERRVEILEQLPERVTALESQIVQLRDEMRSEFSAMRSDLRGEIRAGDESVIMTLREEIRSGDEETRRYMRVLHEDLVGRIATLKEGF
jgi:hypothetical protein